MTHRACKIKKRCGKLRRLFEAQKGLCYYCGKPMRFFRDAGSNCIPSDFATKDHVHPRKLGGKGNIENLVAACFLCNTKKGHKIFVTSRSGEVI